MKTTLTLDDGIAVLKMDDGKVNAMSEDMLTEISEQLSTDLAQNHPTVLMGRTGIFSAGFDLGTFKKTQDERVAMVSAGASLIVQMLEHPRPIIAACTGHAYPMGAFLMMSCDVRYGLNGDYRIGMNEVAISLTVPRFALALARHRLTPPAVALLSSAAMLNPQDAQQTGYLDVVRDDETEMINHACAHARALNNLDFPSYVATKERLNEEAITAIREGAKRDGFTIPG